MNRKIGMKSDVFIKKEDSVEQATPSFTSNLSPLCKYYRLFLLKCKTKFSINIDSASASEALDYNDNGNLVLKNAESLLVCPTQNGTSLNQTDYDIIGILDADSIQANIRGANKYGVEQIQRVIDEINEVIGNDEQIYRGSGELLI